MLKTILSISGKPGLFKLISQGKNILIVESLIDGKKMPSHAQDKAVSLADIAIFTDEEEVSLYTVFCSIKAKENGQKASINPKSDNNTLRAYFAEILPNFDRERVYPSDIKKIITWYNILIDKGYSFDNENTTEESNENI